MHAMKTANSKAVERDWSSLLTEILNLIGKNLSKISDFVRFRAVCTTWRFSTSITDQPPQFPWILEDQDRTSCQDQDEPNLRFYSIPNNEIHTIHAPKILDRRFYPYGRALLEGYIFALPRYNSRQFSILNPLNNDEIHLPVFEFGCGLYWFGHQKNQKGEYVICCGLSYDLELESKIILVFCSLGQENWRGSLPLDSYMENSVHFYLKSMLFIVDITTGVTKVIDITTGTLAYVIPSVGDHLALGRIFLVEASGDILRVIKLYCNKKYLFDVHRLDVNESGSPYWVKVENIGDHALFIDWTAAMVLKANYSARIKANCIYLLTTIFGGIPQRSSYEVERIHIKTGARKHLPCPLKRPKGWFVPNLHRVI